MSPLPEFDIYIEDPVISGVDIARPFGLTAFKYKYQAFFAEFLGTLILVLFGEGSIAQVTFNKAAIGSSYLSINFGWALGLFLGILVSGQISGGHLNPAVTISNALFRKFPWKKVPGYILSQIMGSFVAACLLYAIYWPVFSAFDEGNRQTVGPKATAGIFFTFPNPNAPNWNSFISELIITAFFLIFIMSITDPKHKVPSFMVPIAIGASIFAIGLSVGVMTGYAINPARDFGPRFFTAVAGWGFEPFTVSNYYFWVPIVGPIVGSVVGVFIYDQVIYSEDSEFE